MATKLYNFDFERNEFPTHLNNIKIAYQPLIAGVASAVATGN